MSISKQFVDLICNIQMKRYIDWVRTVYTKVISGYTY